MVRPFMPGRKKPGVDQALQVMAERRGGKIDMGLYVTRCCSFRARLHHAAKNLEPHGMAQRAQTFRMAFEFRRHTILLTFSK